MAIRQSGFTRASALGPIAEVISSQGGSINHVLQDVDLPYSLLENPNLPLPLKEQFRLLNRAAREVADPHFGARLGQYVSTKKLSAFGQWVCDAPRLDEAISRANAGLNVYLQTATLLTLERRETVSLWSIEFLDPESDGRYQNELLGLSYLIDTIRCYAGKNWVPRFIRTTTSDKSQAGVLEQLFRTNVSVGHHSCSVEIPDDVLRLKRYDSNNPRKSCQYDLDEELAVPPGFDDLEAFKAVIRLASLEGYPRIDWVADKVGVTRRTLQRLLASQGTDFSTILESTLKERALDMVGASNCSITDVALALGYTDVAHFSRAFKRWTGLPPKHFRRNQQGAD